MPIPTPEVTTLDDRVLLLAPTGRDSELIEQLLLRSGIQSLTAESWDRLLEEFGRGCGVLILAEEAFSVSGPSTRVEALLRDQPAWSDVPVLLLALRDGTDRNLASWRSALGNVVMIQRPTGVDALASAVASALRARRRQYQVRASLAERERSQTALRAETARLQMLNHFAARLAGQLELEQLAQLVTDTARAATGASSGAFYYREIGEAGDVFRLCSSSGTTGGDFLESETGARLFGLTFRGRAPLRVEDLWCDPRFQDQSANNGGKPSSPPARSHLALPIVSRSGGTMGGLFLSDPAPAVFTKESEELAVGLAAQAAIALQNARLYGEIRTSREHYRHLVEVLPQLVWTSDLSGAFDSLSPQWESYTGIDRASHLGWGWLDAVHPEDRQTVSDSWHDALAARVPFDCEFRLRAADGTFRWFKSRGVPMVEEGDHRDRWIGTCTDIEDQKAGEFALRESSRLKDELLGLVSHELRTPLTTIVGAASLLQRRGQQLDETVRGELLADIAVDAARLQRLIENMLVLSKAELAAEVAVEPVLVQHVLRRIQDENIVRQPDRLQLTTDGAELPVVLANETFLEQILENLIRNAEKYSYDGTPIEVNAATDDGGAWLKITVMDKGDELSGDQVNTMFEPFYRASSAMFRASGLGLGLPVCKRLAEAQGGRIVAKPRAGGGLEVSLLLRTVGADEL